MVKKLPLRIALGNHLHVAPLKDGRVVSDRIQFDFREYDPLPIFLRTVSTSPLRASRFRSGADFRTSILSVRPIPRLKGRAILKGRASACALTRRHLVFGSEASSRLNTAST